MASEAMEDVQPGEKRPALDIESLKRKKFKAEDLPLSAAQHAAIDKLLHSFKKKGGFDSIRKQLWADFNEGESKTMFTDQLIALAESEIEREPAHLSRERGKAATLIEGAVDRGDVYKNVEDSIDRLASKHLDAIMDTVRAIRRQDIGEDAAAKEEQAGSKTDDDYNAHVKEKRDARDEVYREEMRKQKEIEDEQKRIRAEELRKKREIERKKEDEERARRKEIDDQRRAERERLRDEQRALDEQRDRERDERWRGRDDRDRYRGWDRDRSRTRDRDRDRDRDRLRDRSPAYRSDRGGSPRGRDAKTDRSNASAIPTPAPAPPVDEKSLEEAALQMLLKEGEELAAKARQKPEFDFEEAEAIENGLKPGSTATAPAKTSIETKPASTRATTPSRRQEPMPDRTRNPDRGRSRSRSRSHRRYASHYDPNRRRDRSRDASIRPRDRDLDERPGLRDFRERARDERSWRPARRSRSRSRSVGRGWDRDSKRERDRPRSRSRERDHDRRRHDRSRDRSRDRDRDEPRRRARSPTHRRSRSRRSRSRVRERVKSRSRSRSEVRRRSRSGGRRRSRSRRASRTRRPSPARRASPGGLDIDRYVPSTSNRSKSPRRRIRSPEREPRPSAARFGDIDRYMPPSERENDPLREAGKEKEPETTVTHAPAPFDEEVAAAGEALSDKEAAVAGEAPNDEEATVAGEALSDEGVVVDAGAEAEAEEEA
ncbi:unnamed protein product [Penicillium pancosmium]